MFYAVSVCLNFAYLKPCIKGSDSHNTSHPVGKLKNQKSEPIEKFCWIKADTTFEGLKQITYEPKTRVFIGENSPIQPVNTINSITFNIDSDAQVGNNEFCFAGENNTYELSPYFNCFVGGRGSGKSTILNFLGSHAKDTSSSQNFWKKLNPSFDQNNREVFNFDGTEDFEFLGQSEIESFASNKEKFTKAIYDRANIKADNALDVYENNINNSKQKLDAIVELIEKVSKLNFQKNEKTKEKTTLENSLKIIQSEEYQTLTDDITSKSKALNALTQWKEKIEKLLNQLSELSDDNDLADTRDKKGREEAYYLAKSKIKEAIDLLQADFTEDDTTEKTLHGELDNLKTQLEAIVRKAGYTDENLAQIKIAPQRITELDYKIETLDADIAINNDQISKLSDLIQGIYKHKEDFENKINNILEPLQELLDSEFETNSGIDIKKISLNYVFNEDKAWKNFVDEIYKYFKEKYSNNEKGNDVCNFIIDNKEQFLDKSNEDITKFLKEKNTNKQYMVFLLSIFQEDENFKIFLAIQAKCLYDVKTNAKISVSYGGKSIEYASFGQKCTSVIVILLLFGTAPLVIDEPEAHLDSSLIANYLVPLLKQKKNERQIIFATHNANFVINGDAEKIFILKNDAGKTEIIETTIENTENRSELLKLEGGKEAFITRGQKLNIK